MTPPAPPLFPYMTFARTEAFLSPYCLTQSGMPAPDPALLGPELPLDLGPAPVEALPALEACLAELFGVPPARLLVTPGASGAMHLAALRWFRDGARVVTERPSYEPFRALPLLFGARLAIVDRRPEDGWKLDPARAVAALEQGPGPGHLFLCNPHNPTGALLPAEDVARLAGAAAGTGGVLISNESYMECAPPRERVHAFDLAPNALSIGTLTKAYGLGALRCGWIVLGEGLAAEREALADLIYLAHLDLPTVALRAARAALDRLEPLLQPLRRFERESRPHLERWLAEEPRVEGRLGPFGLTAFPRVPGVEDTRSLQRFLAERFEVDVTPGEFFGCPGFLRLGFGLPEATLREGLARLSRGLEAFASA